MTINMKNKPILLTGNGQWGCVLHSFKNAYTVLSCDGEEINKKKEKWIRKHIKKIRNAK